VKVLRSGKSDTREAYQVTPFGDDSNPVNFEGMRAVFCDTEVKGDQIILGYIHPSQLSGIGEKRIFSTDSNGQVKFYIWLHSDGTCDFGGSANHLAQYEALKTAFDQLKSDFNDLVTKFNAHVHPGVTSGSSSTTATITPGTPSSADMSGAKLDNLKTQ
jgi:hypothetical protein